MFIEMAGRIIDYFSCFVSTSTNAITYYNNIRTAGHFDMFRLVGIVRFRGERSAALEAPLGQLKARSR